MDGASIAVGSLAQGPGGQLSVEAGALEMRNGAVVTSFADGRGSGGPIDLKADSVLLDGAGTSLFSETTGTGLVGRVGQADDRRCRRPRRARRSHAHRAERR